MKNVERKLSLAVGDSREAEEAKLEELLELAEKKLQRTRDDIQNLWGGLEDLRENYDAKDVESLTIWHNMESQLQEAKRELLRCEKARRKPYFGRIDFRDPKQRADETYYIGRTAIANEKAEPEVIDWRAPIASVYYENSLGMCSYKVKSEGTFEIDLKRKRTYEIEKDKLVDYFDSDVIATDELLTKYLAKNKKAVLGEIIATIQKEQNAIIRKSPRTNLIIQGVAGSGKTTVAMHRISYILYNFEQEFRPQDFYIVGSNRILLNYITSALPDLDVYDVSQITMEQLFTRLMYEDWDDTVYSIKNISNDKKAAEIKGGYEWFNALEAFCRKYENANISREEIRSPYTDNLLMNAEMIDNYINNNIRVSMQNKINMLNEILMSKYENEVQGKNVTYTKSVKKELSKLYKTYFGRDEWKGSIYELYEDFQKEQLESGKQIEIHTKEFDVYDLASLAYIYKRIKESDEIREASHIVIDEAQDFGMMAYEVLHYCMKDCTYTIMGDVSQNIHFGHGLNDWEALKKLVLTGPYDGFGTLSKSYRNTIEISNFATDILRHGDFPIYPVEPIIRHGNAVEVLKCDDKAEIMNKIFEKINKWKNSDKETIAIVCRDTDEASEVAEILKRKGVELIDSNVETTEFGNGVMVLPIEYIKGLEFDAVLLYNPSKQNFPESDEYVKLLYVATTRALHELSVMHMDELTDLIAKPVEEEKRKKFKMFEEAHELRDFKRREMTTLQKEELDRHEGDKDMAERRRIGPKRVEVIRLKDQEKTERAVDIKTNELVKQNNTAVTESRTKKQTTLNSQKLRPASKIAVAEDDRMNLSPYDYGASPEQSRLRPKGHSRIDNSVKWAKKSKRAVNISSSYGIVQIEPVEDEIIRVRFAKNQLGKFNNSGFEIDDRRDCKWTVKDAKTEYVISTAKIIVKVDKKTGALKFLDSNKNLLLEEQASLPRQVEDRDGKQTWNFFEWDKSEKIYAKGKLKDLDRMNAKARYISFGNRKLRMPLIISEKGYGIGVASDDSVLCCDIPMYGRYISTENKDEIDYFFIYGKDSEEIIEQYKKISCK